MPHQPPPPTAVEAIFATLDSLGYGCLILDQGGRILQTNQNAVRYLEWELEVRSCIQHDDPVDSAAVRDLLREAMRKAGEVAAITGYIIAVPRPAGRPLLLRSLRIEAEGEEEASARVAAVVMLDLEDCPRPSLELLKQIFGLTPAEARLAQRLSCGEGLITIANALGVGIGTLRMQLKAIFWKTGTRRQAELTALLAHLARLSPS